MSWLVDQLVSRPVSPVWPAARYVGFTNAPRGLGRTTIFLDFPMQRWADLEGELTELPAGDEVDKIGRRVAGLAVFVAGTALLAGTAGAHVLTVENRGNGAVQERWVGGGGAAHGTGLVTACEVHHAHGHSAALIDTPWNPAENCTHGP